MRWTGKLIGGLIGFLVLGPVGILVGLFLGHLVDAHGSGGGQGAFTRPDTRLFFNITFAVMGHLSKADGRVTAEEIRMAEQVMAELGLDGQSRQEAMAQFSIGKGPGFDLTAALADFQSAYGRVSQLKLLFLQIQMAAAWADGALSDAEQAVLYEIARRLHIPEVAYRQVEALVAGMVGRGHHSHSAPNRPPHHTQIASAYRALGVSESDSDAVVKRAYRRLISKHHPDRLVSKGLPEELMKAATERTAEIKASYDLIMASRASAN